MADDQSSDPDAQWERHIATEGSQGDPDGDFLEALERPPVKIRAYPYEPHDPGEPPPSASMLDSFEFTYRTGVVAREAARWIGYALMLVGASCLLFGAFAEQWRPFLALELSGVALIWISSWEAVRALRRNVKWQHWRHRSWVYPSAIAYVTAVGEWAHHNLDERALEPAPRAFMPRFTVWMSGEVAQLWNVFQARLDDYSGAVHELDRTTLLEPDRREAQRSEAETALQKLFLAGEELVEQMKKECRL